MEIINQIKSGNQKSLKKLYDNYSGALYGIIIRITKDEFEASIVLQKTFMKIWNNANQYDPEKSSLYTWMSTIARNSAIDAIRLKGYQYRSKTDSYDSIVHNDKAEYIKSEHIDTTVLIEGLDEKYQIILNKIYLEGYSHLDLAKHLDLPLGTIKTRLRKALQILNNEMKNEKKLFLGIILLLLITVISFNI